MKILIIGNMGYVGSVLSTLLRQSYPQAELVGYDTGYFSGCLTTTGTLPEANLNAQIFGDIRNITADVFKGVDAVIQLAAISNDPMGKKFAAVTEQINEQATQHVVKLAKENGVKKFVFASSCSVYGFAEDAVPRAENHPINPLTEYAKSKIHIENVLKELSSDHFKCVVLRFATACGFSPRLRLDLVLNDFVASAFVSKQIKILSDGSPWRPLIDVKDMARALTWATEGTSENFALFNVGSNEFNYQVKDIAKIVADALPGTSVDINTQAAPDKRSYRVDFSLFEKRAPKHKPQTTLAQSAREIIDGLSSIKFNDENFRQSDLIRLHVLDNLMQKNILTNDLHWIKK